MRELRQTINLLRYACSNKTIVLAAFLLTAFGAATIGIHRYSSESNAQAMVQDCDDNAIVRCGVADYGALTAAYDANQNGDVRAIYDHYWIKRTPAPGDQVLSGWAKSDGTVVANGRVVAKNASSIGRQAIMHSHPISIAGRTYYETSHVNGQAFKNPNGQLETIVVLDAQGNFKYAIIKACGNPIYATPVAPPTPPAPKKIQVCDLQSKQVITINEDQFDGNKHSKNLDDCKPKNIQVCELATKQVITITEDKFDSSKHSKNLDDCKVNKIEVCDLATKTVISIDEDQYDSSKHSKNLTDCEEKTVMVKVCDTELKKIVTVSEETAKDSRYSTDLDDCKDKCEVPGKEDLDKDSPQCIEVKTPPVKVTPKPVPVVTAPAELPTTGVEDFFGTVLATVSVSLAAYYYALSRRS